MPLVGEAVLVGVCDELRKVVIPTPDIGRRHAERSAAFRGVLSRGQACWFCASQRPDVRYRVTSSDSARSSAAGSLRQTAVDIDGIGFGSRPAVHGAWQGLLVSARPYVLGPHGGPAGTCELPRARRPNRAESLLDRSWTDSYWKHAQTVGRCWKVKEQLGGGATGNRLVRRVGDEPSHG